jgi:hypothetical protein
MAQPYFSFDVIQSVPVKMEFPLVANLYLPPIVSKLLMRVVQQNKKFVIEEL